MRLRSVLAFFAIALSACGGAEDGLGGDDGAGEVSAEAPSSDSDIETEGVCSLLSISEIEDITGLTVSDAYANSDNGSIYGACVWTFAEAVEEGDFEGEQPQLILFNVESSKLYDGYSQDYPDSGVAGIGDGALSRGDGELILLANGHSAEVRLSLVSRERAVATTMVNAIGLLLVGRI